MLAVFSSFSLGFLLYLRQKSRLTALLLSCHTVDLEFHMGGGTRSQHKLKQGGDAFSRFSIISPDK